MPKLFLSPSGHFEVIREGDISLDDMRLVKLLRAGNPLIVDISNFTVPEPLPA